MSGNMRMTGSYGDHMSVTRCEDSSTSPYRDGPYSHTLPDRAEEPQAYDERERKNHDENLEREKEAIRDEIKKLASTC